MGILRGAGLGVIVFVMILSLTFLIFGLSLYGMLYPDAYIDTLRESGGFDYTLKQSANTPNMFIKIPDEGLEPLAENLLGNFLGYIRSDRKDLNLSVEIDQLKLRGFFLESIKNVSTCPAGKEPDFKDLDKLCRRQGQSDDSLLDELFREKNLSFFAQKEVDLAKVYGIEEGSEGREKIDDLRKWVSIYRYSIYGIAVFVILLGGIIFLLEKGKTPQFLRWTATPFVLTGTGSIISTLLLFRYAVAFLPEFRIPLMEILIISFAHNVMQKVFLYGGIITALGCTLIIISFIHKNPDKKNISEKSNTKKISNVKKIKS